MVPSEIRTVSAHVSKLSDYTLSMITLGYLSCVWHIELIHYSRRQTEPSRVHFKCVMIWLVCASKNHALVCMCVRCAWLPDFPVLMHASVFVYVCWIICPLYYIIPKSQSILFVLHHTVYMSAFQIPSSHLPVLQTRDHWQKAGRILLQYFQIKLISRVPFHMRTLNFQGRFRFSKWSLSPNFITLSRNSEHAASFLRAVCKSIWHM